MRAETTSSREYTVGCLLLIVAKIQTSDSWDRRRVNDSKLWWHKKDFNTATQISENYQLCCGRKKVSFDASSLYLYCRITNMNMTYAEIPKLILSSPHNAYLPIFQTHSVYICPVCTSYPSSSSKSYGCMSTESSTTGFCRISRRGRRSLCRAIRRFD